MLNFKKFLSKKPELKQERFPSSSSANEWMSKKVEHYAKHKPKDLHTLFSPASGDYMPRDVHVGSSWKQEHQEHYRKLKAQHPEAVEKAKELTHGLAGRVAKSTVGDPTDY